MTEITLDPALTPTPEPNGAVAPAQPAAEVVAAVDAILKEARRRPATFDELFAKKLRTADIVIASQDADGDVELVVSMQALSSKAWDDLVAKFPPTPSQKQSGMVYNPDTFGPALVSACCVEPKLTVEEVTTLVTSGSWSSGDVNTLQTAALALCQTGAGVPFTERG